MKIDKVAAHLVREASTAQPGQTVRTRLERGLVLSAKRMDRQWYLAAARVDVYPSDAEALVIARAFGVPLGTEPEWVVKRQRTALATLDWHGIVWTWLEDEEPVQEPVRQGSLVGQPVGAY